MFLTWAAWPRGHQARSGSSVKHDRHQNPDKERAAMECEIKPLVTKAEWAGGFGRKRRRSLVQIGPAHEQGRLGVGRRMRAVFGARTTADLAPLRLACNVRITRLEGGRRGGAFPQFARPCVKIGARGECSGQRRAGAQGGVGLGLGARSQSSMGADGRKPLPLLR